MKKLFYVLIIALLSVNTFAFDNELSCMAIKPGTNEIYVGGTFNSIFVIDAETGKTIKTIKTEQGIDDMQFSSDGSSLIGAKNNKVYYIDLETGKNLKTISGTSFQLFDNSPYFVDNAWYGDLKTTIYDSNTGKIFKEITLDFKPVISGFNEDYTELIIVSREQEIKSSEEKKSLKNKIVAEQSYNVYNSTYVKQVSDGSGSIILTYDLKNDEEISRIICPFNITASFGTALIKKDKTIFIAAWDVLLSIDSKGLTTAIEYEKSSFAYAANYTSTLDFLCVSSTKTGYLFDLNDSKTFKEFDFRENYEFAYSCDIFSTESKLFVLAKDYTISYLDYDKELHTVIKIDRSNENGFDVLYYNGYTKKEDRDKEAAIINTTLSANSLAKVDLETDLGKSDFFIANFKTVEKAEAFVKILDDKGLSYIVKIVPAESKKEK